MTGLVMFSTDTGMGIEGVGLDGPEAVVGEVGGAAGPFFSGVLGEGTSGERTSPPRGLILTLAMD